MYMYIFVGPLILSSVTLDQTTLPAFAAHARQADIAAIVFHSRGGGTPAPYPYAAQTSPRSTTAMIC